ncbi:MAG TPA: DUF72 domain-containing protein [Anaerolineae bacterium]|nr:DUF72 domain-containing protein [Anaerolineae bacterium]
MYAEVAHCIHDMRPLQVPLRVTAKTVYLCFHGGRRMRAARSHPKTPKGAKRDFGDGIHRNWRQKRSPLEMTNPLARFSDRFYTRSELEMWAERIQDWERQRYTIFVYFNNDPHGYAIGNARWLKGLLDVKEYEGDGVLSRE